MFVVYQHPNQSRYRYAPCNPGATRCGLQATQEPDVYLPLRLAHIKYQQEQIRREREQRRRMEEVHRRRLLFLEYERRRQALASMIAQAKREEAIRRRAMWVQQQREKRQQEQVFGALFAKALREAYIDSDRQLARLQAAVKIQRFYRNHRRSNKPIKSSPAITAKLNALTGIASDLAQLRNQLRERVANTKGKISPRDFLGLEEEVIKILLRLDAIQSDGVEIVRQRRKSLVETAQDVLGNVDVERKKFESNVVKAKESEQPAPRKVFKIPIITPEEESNVNLTTEQEKQTSNLAVSPTQSPTEQLSVTEERSVETSFTDFEVNTPTLIPTTLAHEDLSNESVQPYIVNFPSVPSEEPSVLNEGVESKVVATEFSELPETSAPAIGDQSDSNETSGSNIITEFSEPVESSVLKIDETNEAFNPKIIADKASEAPESSSAIDEQTPNELNDFDTIAIAEKFSESTESVTEDSESISEDVDLNLGDQATASVEEYLSEESTESELTDELAVEAPVDAEREEDEEDGFVVVNDM